MPTLAAILACAGCGSDMADQPRIDPLESSNFFADGQSARPLVSGTVARGHLRIDKPYFEGKKDGKPVTEFPLAKVGKEQRLSGSDQDLTRKILERGQQRFNIFCAACHDRTGGGKGMVVQRGFPAPPSYHSDRLRDMPIGHFYEVITNGFGRMPDHASQIPPADRWAISAYVRALQQSQHVDAKDLSAEDQKALKASRTTP